jgi:predicted RNA binding protein YcfA (HicA-like mRNA interferase family)
MSQFDKILLNILSGQSDANIRFDELCTFLEKLGFEKRIRGSHHIYRRDGIMDKINLQKDGNLAKPYQIKQVRKVIVENNLGAFDEQI